MQAVLLAGQYPAALPGIEIDVCTFLAENLPPDAARMPVVKTMEKPKVKSREY